MATRREAHVGHVRRRRLQDPRVEDDRVVDPNAHSIVRRHREAVRPGDAEIPVPGPPHRKRVRFDAGVGGPEAPVEIDIRIGPIEYQVRQVGIVEVIPAEGVDRNRVGRRRRWRRTSEGDAADRAAVVIHVEQIASGSDLEVDGTGGRRHEGHPVVRIRQAVRAGEHHPDAVPGVVPEKEGSVVLGWVRAPAVERESRDRRGARRTRLAREDRRAVVVRVVRRSYGRRTGHVEVLADVEVGAIVAGLAVVPLVARPTEVLDRYVGGAHESIDLFPRVPANVANPQLIRAGPNREPERVAKAVRHDPLGVRVPGPRVAGRGGSGRRIDPEDRPVQRRGIGNRLEVLAAKRPAFGGGGRHRASRGIPARVPHLAVVHVIEGGSVAAGDVQHSIRAEREVADRVARVLLAPVLDQHLLGAGHHVAGGLEARQPPAHDATVRRGPRRGRARVRADPGFPPSGSGAPDHGVVGVERVDPRLDREIRVQREAEEAAVPEIVGVRPQVGEDRRRSVGEVVEDLDDPALFGDEDPAVGRETDGGRLRQAAQGDRLLKAAGEGRGSARDGRERIDDGNGR